MILDLIDNVAKRSCWIFDLHVKEGDSLIVHLPLVYRSPIYAEIEAYARAVDHFAAITGNKEQLNVRIVDDCVFSFSISAYTSFKLRLAAELPDPAGIGAMLAAESIRLRKAFAASCLELEKKWIHAQPLHRQFAFAYGQLVTLISINLANPLYEALYLFLHHHKANDLLFENLKKKYLAPPTFSHFKWFSDETQKVFHAGQDVSVAAANDYFWNTSFLKESTTNVSSIDSINEKLSSDYTLSDFAANYPHEPVHITYDPANITEAIPVGISETENIFFMLRLLQVNEEYRHYWQARFMRCLKLCFTDEQLENSNFQTLYKIIAEYEPATS